MNYFFILSAILSLSFCQPPPPEEELCRYKPCGGDEDCRVQQTCASSACRLQAICLPKPQSQYLSGGCLIGEPLLQLGGGGQLDLAPCYNNRPCPSGFFCSTALQDVAARCCRSDSVSPPTAGTCPTLEPAEYWCVKECLTDGDCYQDMKCCDQSCSGGGTAKTCAMPATSAPPAPPAPPLSLASQSCATVRCNPGTVCQVIANGQPRCVTAAPSTPVLQPHAPRVTCPEPWAPYGRGECSWRNQCKGATCTDGRICCATYHCGNICRYPVYL